MTRRDFELIARAVRETLEMSPEGADSGWDEGGYNDGVRAVAEYLADDCAATNPRFDLARFLAACGLPKS